MSAPGSLRYRWLPGEFSVCRLDPTHPAPEWARGEGYSNITRTANELSVICAAQQVPPGVRAETGWRVLEVLGPLPFDVVGVLARIAGPLAEARIPILATATFDTDYVLVREIDLAAADAALLSAGLDLVT